MSKNRTFIISFHDLAPHSQGACQQFLDELHPWGINRISLLVVPKWHEGALFCEDKPFVSWLRTLSSQGHDVCLHGFTHQAEVVKGGVIAQIIGKIYTAKEGEFYQISYEEAHERLSKGLQLLRNEGLVVEGFTPPAWLMNEAGRRALCDVGVTYSTTLQHFETFAPYRKHYAPTLVFSSRAAWRRCMSAAWVKFWLQANRHSPLLRIAVHPGDMKYTSIRKTLFQLIHQASQTREAVTYAQQVRCLPVKPSIP